MDCEVVYFGEGGAVFPKSAIRTRVGVKETGHSLFWINDVELWKLADNDPKYPHDTLPVRDEFLANCRAFYESRLKNTRREDLPVSKTVFDDN